MTRKPLTAAASIPHAKGTAVPGGNPSFTSFAPLNRPAPSMIGSDSRNENRAAERRSRPMPRAAVMVTPDREVGQRAVAPRRAVDDEQDHPEYGQHHRDQPGLSEILLDHVLSQGAGDGTGDRADHQEPGQAFVHRSDRPGPDRPEP